MSLETRSAVHLLHEYPVVPGDHAHITKTKHGHCYIMASSPFTKRTRVAAVQVDYPNGSEYIFHFRNPLHAFAWYQALTTGKLCNG